MSGRRAVVIGGSGAAGLIALGRLRRWRKARRPAAEVPPARYPATGSRPSPTGDGLVVVVNAAAGSAGDDIPQRLAELLPDAEVVVLGEGDDLEAALGAAAGKALALGMAGGDGSLNAAAAVARDHGLPLVAIPAGTLNHLARDLGLEGVDDAARAVIDGDLAAMDLGLVAGRPFLNTASFGSYPALVDARELLEDKIGKWPALVLALVRVLWRGRPAAVEIDGEAVRLWMIFIGNCRYQPSGFAPSRRERLDDGMLDVRTVSAEHPQARLRLIAAVLSGRLGRCRVYDERPAREIRVRSLEGPLRLARDGETFDGPEEFTVTKAPAPLLVYVPRPT